METIIYSRSPIGVVIFYPYYQIFRIFVTNLCIMYLYITSDNILRAGDNYLPLNKFYLFIYPNEVVELRDVKVTNVVLSPIEVTLLQKEDGSTYSDLAELLNLIGDAFAGDTQGYQAVFTKGKSGIYQNDLMIKSTCGTSDGTVLLLFTDLTGVTIVSHLGSATPIINGNTIEYSVGNIFYLELSNGSDYSFKEGAGNTIYDNSGNGKHTEITFTAAGIQPYPSQAFLQALAEFWGEKSEYAEPVERFGYTKYITSATTEFSSHLALPDNSNVGVELLLNGDFSSWESGVPVSWASVGDGINSGITEHLGGLRIFSINGDNAGVNQSTAPHVHIKLEYTILEYIEGQLKVPLWDGTTDFTIIPTTPGKHVIYGEALNDTFYIYRDGSACDITIDSISIKEVQAIPAYGIWNIGVIAGLSSPACFFINSFTRTYPLADGYRIVVDIQKSIVLQQSLGGSLNALFI